MKKNLFLYIDYTFSFGFGHYINIFSNLYSITQRQGYDFCLVHDDWKYYEESESGKFDQFPHVLRIKSNREELISNCLESLSSQSYQEILVYTYKGSIEMINELALLHDIFQSHGVEVSIVHTLFTIPTEHMNLEHNVFSSEFTQEITSKLSLIDERNIRLVFDVRESIWNKYVPTLEFLPPPLLKSDEIQYQKTLTNKRTITLGLDIWNINHSPSYRFESIDHISQLITTLLENNKSLHIKLKIADSSFNMDKANYSYHLHERLEIIRFLSDQEYDEYLNSIDLYILQYAPEYYKNKSSGHLLELLQRGIITIGTKNTFLENYISNSELLYEFGNIENLLATCQLAINNFQDLQYQNSDKAKVLIRSWTKSAFYKKVITQLYDNNKQSNKILKMKSNEPSIIILGNGPSLRGYDFKNFHDYTCIGMNAAYRYWDRINWYPTFYICLDTIVIKSHHDEIKRLIDKSEEYGIKKFYLREIFFEFQPKYKKHTKVVTYEDLIEDNVRVFDCIHITTGSFSARLAIHEGFKNIILLGIDENYINFIKESKLKEDITLEITRTPKDNPNYFFEDYQQKGDLYQIANHHRIYRCNCRHCNGEIRRGENLHVEAWRFIQQDLFDEEILAMYGQVSIVNCNPKSNVKYFPFLSYDEALQMSVEEKCKLQSKYDPTKNNPKLQIFKSIIMPMVTFLGKSKMIENESNINSILGELDSYRISIKLKSFFNKNSFHPYGETAPPMPCILGPIAIYDMGDVFKIGIKEEGKSKDILLFENNFTWISIDFIKSKDTLGINVNDSKLYESKVGELQNHNARAIIGSGFLKRYWRGEFDKIEIFNMKNECLYQLKTSNINNLFNLQKTESSEIKKPKNKSIKEAENKSNIVQIPKNLVYHSSSETGQDRWVVDMLQGRRNGFFLDLGASDGISANNSLTLQKYFDWKGILIEGNSLSYKKLIRNRPNQVCVQAIVADEEKEVEWRENDKVLTRSGINDTLPLDNNDKSWRVGEKILRKTQTLTSILEANNAPADIDFLTIDIEGGEINALKNFPFDKYTIHVLSAEVGFNNRKEFYAIMDNNGFRRVDNPYCSVTYESFFVNKKFFKDEK